MVLEEATYSGDSNIRFRICGRKDRRTTSNGNLNIPAVLGGNDQWTHSLVWRQRIGGHQRVAAALATTEKASRTLLPLHQRSHRIRRSRLPILARTSEPCRHLEQALGIPTGMELSIAAHLILAGRYVHSPHRQGAAYRTKEQAPQRI